MKTALITGANRGIGLETARQLGALGYRVVLAARDEAKLERALATLREAGGAFDGVALDVTDAGSIAAAAKEVGDRYGVLDVLVNNAGVLDHAAEQGPSQVSVASLRRTFEVNLFGPVAVCQAFLPLLEKAEAPRIVNVSSALGSLAEHSDPNGCVHHAHLTGYDTSKAALNLFTVELAQELEERGIKVNAAHPGHVKTDMGGADAPLAVEAGAETTVWLATLGEAGPTGGFFHRQVHMRW